MAVGSNESVPEEGVGGENTVEYGGRIRRERGTVSEGVGEGNEMGNEEVVLFEASLDDAGVDLVKVFGSLAGFQ